MKTIYIGNSVVKEGLIKYTVYLDRPTDLIDRLKEKYSLIERLFISIDEFVEKQDEIEKKATLIDAARQQLLKN